MLTSLWIWSCKELVSLANGLKGQSIWSNWVRKTFPSSKSFSIRSCNDLKRLPELEKSSLVYLEIVDCPHLEFSSEDFQHLVALQTLELKRLSKLACFPEGIKHTAMLKSLSIECCPEDVLDLPDWIGSLTSLQRLTIIHGCKNQTMLPEGLQHHTSFQHLMISGCDPDLERRCKKDKGEDWYETAMFQRFISRHSDDNDALLF